MRAVVIHRPHDLRIEERPVPEPGPGMVRVRIAAGGICGSDLHYYHSGGFGTVRVVDPMILGHEASGTIDALGEGVAGRALGERVAVNPNRTCGRCRYCRAGQGNLCADVYFFGSAMRRPHVDGAFRDFVVVEPERAVPVADACPLAEAAMAEPLAVALHAAHRAGALSAKRVLVTGAGPIGILCAAAARHAGAAEVTVTDIVDEPLAVARAMGVDRAINVAAEPDALAADKAGRGTIDAAFECSGSAAGIADALAMLRPGGRLVQVGLGATPGVPISLIATREIMVVGTFRFFSEFDEAVALIASRAIDVRPMISASAPAEDAVEAFDLASDRRRSVKVQLAFSGAV